MDRFSLILEITMKLKADMAGDSTLRTISDFLTEQQVSNFQPIRPNYCQLLPIFVIYLVRASNPWVLSFQFYGLPGFMFHVFEGFVQFCQLELFGKLQHFIDRIYFFPLFPCVQTEKGKFRETATNIQHRLTPEEPEEKGEHCRKSKENFSF